MHQPDPELPIPDLTLVFEAIFGVNIAAGAEVEESGETKAEIVAVMQTETLETGEMTEVRNRFVTIEVETDGQLANHIEAREEPPHLQIEEAGHQTMEADHEITETFRLA
jgi:hypothetical protein